jgi:hypothetical protein
MWPAVVDLAGRHLVTPALWLGLRAPENRRHLPQDAVQYLQALYDLNAERNRRILAQLDEILGAFNRASIKPLLLKGGAYLKLNAHKGIGARTLTDLDILVQRDSFTVARAALDQIGYRPMGEGTRFHHDDPLVREGDVTSVELHWSPLGRRAANVLGDGAFWTRALETTDEAGSFYVLAPTDAVMLTFAHSQIVDRHAQTFQISLRALQDVVALAELYGDRIDWRQLAADSSSYGYGPEWLNFLYVAARITGVRLDAASRFGFRQMAYYALCEAGRQSPFIGRWLFRLAQLSKHEIRGYYGGNPGPWGTNFRRLRFIADRLQMRWFPPSG